MCVLLEVCVFVCKRKAGRHTESAEAAGGRDDGKIGGTVWIEEVVLHSTDTTRKSGKAMQRKMAQPFEAEHQGTPLP